MERKTLPRDLLALAGLTPNGEYDPEDVFIVGYPKSGNTWVRHLVAGTVFGVDPALAPFGLIADLVPGHRRRVYRRYRTPMFFKSHAMPRPDYRRVVYLLRDGRDVMVSYYHHLRAVTGRPVDFAAVVRGEARIAPFEYRWHEHVEAWRRNPHGAEMLTLRYEALAADPVREMRRFCEFAGLDRSDAEIRWAVDKGSFENLRAKEETQGLDNPNWPREAAFVRRGEVGSFRDEMPPEVLALFLESSGPTMRACQYVP